MPVPSALPTHGSASTSPRRALLAEPVRAVGAGAKLEAPAKDTAYGRIAMLADPFGHGFCLLQFNQQGYDALLAG